jgi:hypothetical protein
VAHADTVVFWGGGVCGTSSALPVAAHAGTGCPSTGSWLVQTLAIGTDGTVCVCTVAGSPGTWVEVCGAGAINDLSDVTITAAATGEVIKYNGTAWVDGTIDGSDVGLADSPGSDGVYQLTRSSGTNSWTAASGGGGASWTAGTTEGLETLNTSGVVLARWPLPSGWMAAGSSAHLVADLLTISNASSRLVDLRWQFRDVSDSPVFYITGSAATGLSTPVGGQAFQCQLNVYISDVSSGFFFRTATKTTLSTSVASSTVYVEAMSSLATATQIVLLGDQDAGSDTTMTAFAIRGMDTTP